MLKKGKKQSKVNVDKSAYRKKRYVIGIDEVGRGALAGPVTVAALAQPFGFRPRPKNKKLKLRDSKKLTPKHREQWLSYLRSEKNIFYSVSHIPPRTIDKLNISRAANLAAAKALKKLLRRAALGNRPGLKVFLDGGLYIKDEYKFRKFIFKTIVKGDEKITAIKLASIVAKVNRDKLMLRLGKIYPKYGFPAHKGYGTALHFRKIKKNGISRVHRLSFCGRFL